MMRKFIYILVLCSLVSLQGVAQSLKVIKGKVMDASTHKPLMNTIVSSTFSVESILTDSLGQFELELKQGGNSISLDKIGYSKRTVLFAPNVEQKYYLTPISRAPINERVMASGRIKKGNITSIISSPDFQDFKKGANYADELLYGTVSGLQTFSKGGMPGEGTYLGLRGIRSFMAESTPLIVVDGLVYMPNLQSSNVYTEHSYNPLLSIAAKNVDNISFLRGYAASPYGSLGSNGVIYIQTENASDLETRVEFQTTNGVSYLLQTLPSLNAEDNKNFLSEIASTTLSPNDLQSKFPFLFSNSTESPLYFNNTVWMDYVYKPAFTSDNVLTIKGGDAIAKYALTFGYIHQEGIQKETQLGRYYTRMNANMNVTPKINIFANIAVSYTQKKLAEQGNVEQVNPALAALLKPSFLGPWLKDNDGNDYNVLDPIRDFGISNPHALTELVEAESSMFDIMANFGLNYLINTYLNAKVNIGMYYDYTREDMFIPGVTSGTIAPLEGGMAKNTLRNGTFRNSNYYGNANLTYERSFHEHKISAVAGGHFLYDQKADIFAKGINTATDYDNTFAGVKEVYGRLMLGSGSKNLWLNAYTQLEYTWADLLHLGAALTIDKSTFDVRNNQGVNVYPAVNLGWNISNLHFFRKGSFFENITLRAEYAQSGNSRIGGMIGGQFYSGNPYLMLSGIVPITQDQDHLSQERIENSNIGIDIRTRGNKFAVAIDIYNEVASDLIVQRTTPINDGNQISFVNAGKVQTQGIDIALHADIITYSQFHWRVGTNLSYNNLKNGTFLGGDPEGTPCEDGFVKQTSRETPFQFYGYKSEGVISTKEKAEQLELMDYKGRYFEAGDIEFLDVDNNHIIDSEDQTNLGSILPKLFGSFYTSLTYKSIRLNVLFSGACGHKIYNSVRRTGESMISYANQLESVNNRWIIDGQRTDIPRAVFGDPMGNSRFSSRWIEDGDYLKLKKVVLSYTWTKNLGFIHQLETFVQGENLFTWTRYKGIDPEIALNNNISGLGLDKGKVPNPSCVKLGIKFNF